MKLNRKKFFDAYRVEFGGLTQAQVNGLEQLLGFIENDRYVTTVEVGGFLLGTTKHETADTYKPIHEYGGKAYFIKRYGGQTRKGKELGNDTPEEGYDYAGKGYPQTTGESNYERLEDALRIEYPEIIADFEKRTGKRFDLTVGDQPNDKSDPQNMLDPAIAYVSMSYGSRVGLFTGRKLSQYDLKTDAGRKGSRRIINGQDKATLIAGYIAQFIQILKASKVSGVSTPAAVQTATDNTSPSDEPQNSEPPTNIETTIVEAENGVVTSTTTTTQEEAEIEGVKPYNGKGLGGTLKDDAKAILPANFGLGVISEWLQQTAGLPPWVATLLPKLVIALLICTLLWVLYRVITWAKHTWVENERVKLLAIINSDKSRKDIVLK